MFTQPIVYELGQLSMSVLLMIGGKDTTAIGNDLAPASVQAMTGDHPKPGRGAAAAIPQARLVEFADLEHALQIQRPDRFHKALLERLTPCGPVPDR